MTITMIDSLAFQLLSITMSIIFILNIYFQFHYYWW